MDTQTASANSSLAFRLLAELASTHRDENVFISPVSISLALAIAHSGAGSETRQAIARVLQLPGLWMTPERFGRDNAALLQSLASAAPSIHLQIATAAWIRPEASFQEGFSRQCKELYHAELGHLDFEDPGAVETINAWVREKTSGKIKTIG